MDQIMTLSRSRPDSPEFREALIKHLDEAAIKSGEAFNSNGPDFIWAVEAATSPTLIVDDQPVVAMRRISGTNLWFHTGQRRGIPQGRISEKLVHTSKLCGGMESNNR